MLVQLIILSVSLALDAVSVSIASGVKTKHNKLNNALRVGLYFGIFQAVMPLLGWLVGDKLKSLVSTYSPWIAFLLLLVIGVLMIIKAFKEEEEEKRGKLSHKTLTLLAIATSIDAFVVGISLGLIKLPLLLSVSVIGIITFLLCVPAFLFGSQINKYFGGKLEILGGIALIGIGCKILLSAIS